MSKITAGLLVAGLLLGSGATNATSITWQMRGTITGVIGFVPVFPAAQVGDPYTVEWTFDTDALLLAAPAYPPGTRYDYDNSALVVTAWVGASDPVVFVRGSDSPSTFNRILLRDDASDQPVDGLPADGIGFSLLYDALSSVTMTFRTTDLNVVAGPGLPVNPYPGMESFPVSTFQITHASGAWSLLGPDVISVSRVVTPVPEPGSLALLGLGLAGLGLSGRRLAM